MDPAVYVRQALLKKEELGLRVQRILGLGPRILRFRGWETASAVSSNLHGQELVRPEH